MRYELSIVSSTCSARERERERVRVEREMRYELSIVSSTCSARKRERGGRGRAEVRRIKRILPGDL